MLEYNTDNPKHLFTTLKWLCLCQKLHLKKRTALINTYYLKQTDWKMPVVVVDVINIFLRKSRKSRFTPEVKQQKLAI